MKKESIAKLLSIGKSIISNNIFFPLLLLIALHQLQAQSFSNKNLNDLVMAEQDFIADAKKFGTKNAFFNHLADSAITFGKTIRKGKKNFEGPGDTTSWLNWRPVYTDISSTGDFGYNTGPWEYWNNRSDEKPAAFGEFVTIWKVQPNGKWKAEIDIGIFHNFPLRSDPISTSGIPLDKTIVNKANKLLDMEKRFISNPEHHKVFSKEVRFYRDNKLPITSAIEIEQLLEGESEVSYNPIDGMASTSGDLGFVYGTAFGLDTSYYYLRIWKKEDGKNWKVVLDLLTKN